MTAELGAFHLSIGLPRMEDGTFEIKSGDLTGKQDAIRQMVEDMVDGLVDHGHEVSVEYQNVWTESAHFPEV